MRAAQIVLKPEIRARDFVLSLTGATRVRPLSFCMLPAKYIKPTHLAKKEYAVDETS